MFALTDEAFVKLPAGPLENLLKPKQKSELPTDIATNNGVIHVIDAVIRPAGR